MKILLLSYTDNLGAGKAAQKIYTMLKKNNNDVELIVKKKSFAEHKKFNIINLNHKFNEIAFDTFNFICNKALNNRFFPKPYKSLGWYESPYSEIINKSNYDIIQLHWINNFLSIKDISKIKKKIVWRFSDMWPILGIKHYATEKEKNMNFFFESLEKINLKKKKKFWIDKINVITPSKWLKAEVEKSEIANTWPVDVIYTPIDTDQFKPLASKQEFKNKSYENTILFGADNLNDKRKGLEDILNLFKNRLVDQDKKFNLFLFGKGKIEYKKINNLIIHNFGHLDNYQEINNLFNNADVMILPSKIDNLPQIGLEAQTSGLPIILYKNSGLQEVIEEKKTGLFAEDQNLKSLARAINIFFKKEKKERNFMRQESRSRAVRLWGEKVIIEKYNNLYKKILNE